MTEPARTPVQRSSVHVLLVEDDPLIAMVTRRAFKQLSRVAKVTVAVDGKDAFDRLRNGECSAYQLIIVLDLSMPRMSGLELVAAIDTLPAFRSTPIAVLTSSDDPADRVAAVGLHVVGYFVKSAGHGHLDAILAWLTGYDTAQQPRSAR